MKHILTICCCIFGLASCQMFSESEQQPITTMSYNIKFDDPDDENTSWDDHRKQQISALIAFYEPDFLGTQEGLHHQLKYLDKNLDSYKWIGVGRDDGSNDGEFSALFYNNDKFELIEDSEQTIWLSKTPEKPSKNWDAALPRILTFGKFRNRSSDQKFWVFNTHFDHVGDTARVESARLILDTIKEKTGDVPVILTGDFNVTEEMQPYEILTSSDSNLSDTYYATEKLHVGPDFTYEGYEVMAGEDQRRIDYIFVNERLRTRKHAILSSFHDGRYPSDHLPVLTTLEIKE